MLLILKSLARLIAWLPLAWALGLGRVLGRMFGALVPTQGRRAREAFQACFPEASPAEVRQTIRRTYAHLGMNMIELLRWMGGREEELKQRICVENEEALLSALARGRGVVSLVAHVGNWDLMGLWAASRYPLTIISKEIKHEALNRFWMEKRAAAGLHIVGARNSYRACLATLKRGGCLGFILDQNMIRKEGVFVDFFGRPACTTSGLALLAAHAQAPVVPIFMIREPDGRHRLRMFDALEPPADRQPQTLAAATQQYTRIVEAVIRQHPEQWIWMHRRWRTKPPVVPDAE